MRGKQKNLFAAIILLLLHATSATTNSTKPAMQFFLMNANPKSLSIHRTTQTPFKKQINANPTLTSAQTGVQTIHATR
jgi:hypothetical protein